METRANIFVGVAGWSYPDWEGIVYPRSNMDQLAYLCSFVDCIEINSTFYRPPDEKTAVSWLERTAKAPGFFFTAKLHKDFTHDGRIDPDHADRFKKGLDPLHRTGKLRDLLVQFRYDFTATADNRAHLRRIVELFGETYPLVVEVRHRSWQQPEHLDFLRSLNVTLCNLDYPIGPDSFDLPDVLLTRRGYMRLHGRNAEKWFAKSTRDETYDYCYSHGELEEIAKRIERLADRSDTYTVVANNHYRGAELANALELKHLLTGLKQAVPEPLFQKYPRLSEIARNPHLF